MSSKDKARLPQAHMLLSRLNSYNMGHHHMEGKEWVAWDIYKALCMHAGSLLPGLQPIGTLATLPNLQRLIALKILEGEEMLPTWATGKGG